MINCTINGKKRSFDIDPTCRLRELLLMNGNFAVRDSDDAEGFCGSDTVLLDGTPATELRSFPIWYWPARWKAARSGLLTASETQ